MQSKITLKNLSAFCKTICVVLCIALISGNVKAQTLTTAGGTNYLGDYSVTNTNPLSTSFVIENTGATPLALTGVSTQLGPWTIAPAITPAGTPVISKLYYSATSLSGNYDLSTAAWTQIGSGSAVVPATVAITPVISCIYFVIPANTQYRFVIEASRGLRFSFSPTPTPNVFTTGSASLKVGNNQIAGLNIGYAGLTPMPAAGNTPAFFGGSVVLVNAGACAGTPAPGNTVSTAAAVCPGVGFVLSPQNCTVGSGVTYQWQSSATGAAGSYTNVAGATGSTLSVASITASTYYQVIVTCGGVSTTATPVQVTLNGLSSCYCTPAASDCTDGDDILNVTLNQLNNTSTCSATGYTNYSTNAAITVPTVIMGVANRISVTVGVPFLLPENIAVWIDYNKNGTFEASEFTLIGSTTAGGVVSNNINVPTTATAGTTRMRVRSRWNTAITGADACTTFAYGETEDYTVNLAPCVTSSITTQPPAATTVSCSGTGTITATIAGSLNQYQWQVLVPGAGAVWTDLANGAQYTGVTTNTLTITNALPTLTGNQYRVRYQGACTSPNVSTASTLTVGALAPTVSNTLPINRCNTAAPTAISIATPVGLASLSTTNSGTLHTNIPDNNDETAGQNTNFISNNLTVAGIPTGAIISAFNVKLNITHNWAGDLVLVLRAPNGRTINLAYALTATGGLAGTTGFTNTVISSTGTAALSSGTNPYTATFRLDNAGPSQTGFTPTGPAGFDPNTTTLADMYQGNGVWTLALYDYYQDNLTTNFLENWELNITYQAPPAAVFTPATGLFTDAAGTVPYVAGTLANTVYAAPAASTTYSATVNTAVCGAGTVSIPVNVGSPLSGTSTVANMVGCVGGSVTFSSTAPTGGLNATYQWQDSSSTATWTNIPGATSATYTISNLTTALSGRKYRVIRTVASCTSTLTSAPGTLTVANVPTLGISASPGTAIYPGQTTTIAVAASTTVPANGYTWFKDGVAIQGQTTNTRVVNIDDLGTYTVQVADANGCGAAAPASIAITAAANDILFIYPSPNNGQFQIRYFSEFGPTIYPRLVNIYDSKGSRVYSKSYSINSPYTRLDVNANGILTKGIYSVELIDFNGNRIKTGRVVIN